jgi:hypothetical protein
MLRTRPLALAFALLCSIMLPTVCMTASGQTASPTVHKLSLTAAVVLAPEFCATKTKKGTWMANQETFAVGAAACADIEPALKDIFSNLTRVESSASSGDAQLVLMPRFVDVNATQKGFAFSDREMIVSVEWTAKDNSGKTVWVGTVQGSAKHHMGNSFTYKKNLKLIVADSVKDMAEQSAVTISSSPELLKLANGISSSVN